MAMARRAVGSARARSRVEVRPEGLEGRAMLAGIVVTGADVGRPPVIAVADADTGAARLAFRVEGAGLGGVRVAVGDLDGDGTPEIVAAASDAGGRAAVWTFRSTDGAPIARFDLPGVRGPVHVATGDVDGDNRSDIVVGAGDGVRVLDGRGTVIRSTRAFAGPVPGGVRVAAADLDGDARADVVAAGGPIVRVFSGATGAPLASLRPFDGPTRGGIHVAAGDVDGDRRPDLVASTGVPGGGRVAVFRGYSDDRVADFRVRGAGFSAGTRVAAVDLDRDRVDELAVAPASPIGGSQVLVFRTTAFRREASNPFTYAFGGTPPAGSGLGPGGVSARSAGGVGAVSEAPPVAYALPAPARGTSAFVAATTSAETPASEQAVRSGPTITPLQRLGRVVLVQDGNGQVAVQFVPVSENDPALAGKNVRVLVHGWAPGYEPWVDFAASNGSVLLWWQTFQGQAGYSPPPSDPGPYSAWLLQALNSDGVQVASTGMAQAIANMVAATTAPEDPDAVVLAYSWIDESATDTMLGIPIDASRSEARAAMNGERLAVALQQALGGSGFAGKLQLAGHSHGSKVATVAAAALAAGPTPIRVDQLTLLDSPEAGYLVDSQDAANFNWYLLQNSSLVVSQAGTSGTFVDNYVSEFGRTYNNIQVAGPGSGNVSSVVDVTLRPDRLYWPWEFSARHGYAPYWYSGSAQPSVNPSAQVGMNWSPLLPANAGPNTPPADVPNRTTQTWTSASQAQQFALGPIDQPAVTPTFTSGALDGGTTTTVSLSTASPSQSSYTGTLATASAGISGYTFAYQFSGATAGDLLTISVGTLLGSTLEFVMDAGLVGGASRPAVISLGMLSSGSNYSLTFQLTSASNNPNARVTVTNLGQFYLPG